MLNNISLTQYFNKFILMLCDPKNRDKSQEQLYTELEAWHIKKFGYNKCKTYESFRSLKSQFYKANRP